MIKYSAEDIIKRAEQLADLENSDFISNYEKLALLNESFQILYQKIINTNDKTWIKQKPVYDGMPLPEDFYQLSRLYIKNSREQITKRNASQNYGYELLGNQIFISRDCNNLEIIMEYYPVPPSIHYSPEDEENDTILDFPNNLFYIVLAYMLAIAFKNKQSADTTAITAMYETALVQFFDSINRDANTYYTIKDCYANKSNIWR